MYSMILALSMGPAGEVPDLFCHRRGAAVQQSNSCGGAIVQAAPPQTYSLVPKTEMVPQTVMVPQTTMVPRTTYSLVPNAGCTGSVATYAGGCSGGSGYAAGGHRVDRYREVHRGRPRAQSTGCGGGGAVSLSVPPSLLVAPSAAPQTTPQNIPAPGEKKGIGSVSHNLSPADAVICLVNEHRVMTGLKPLAVSAELSGNASRHAEVMTKKGMVHSKVFAAESIAQGQRTPEEVVESLKGSKDHSLSVDSLYEIGVGVAQDAKGKTSWVIEMR